MTEPSDLPPVSAKTKPRRGATGPVAMPPLAPPPAASSAAAVLAAVEDKPVDPQLAAVSFASAPAVKTAASAPVAAPIASPMKPVGKWRSPAERAAAATAPAEVRRDTEAFSESLGDMGAGATDAALAGPAALAAAVAPLADTAAPIVTPPDTPAAPEVDPVTEAATETMRNVAAGWRGAVPGFGFGSRAAAQAETGMADWFKMPMTFKTDMTRAMEDFSKLGAGYVEALVQGGQIWAKGCQSMAEAVAECARSRMEQGVERSQAMMSATSMAALAEMQRDFVRASFESAVSDNTRLSELGLRVTREALEPINREFSAAVDRFSRATG